MSDRTVEIFHRKDEFAILDDGSRIPITKWMDGEGLDVDCMGDTVTAVAGPDSDGRWHTLCLDEFDPVTTH